MTELDKAIATAAAGCRMGGERYEAIIRRHIQPVVDSIGADIGQRVLEIYKLRFVIGELREALEALMMAVPTGIWAKEYYRAVKVLTATRDLTTLTHHDTIVT